MSKLVTLDLTAKIQVKVILSQVALIREGKTCATWSDILVRSYTYLYQLVCWLKLLHSIAPSLFLSHALTIPLMMESSWSSSLSSVHDLPAAASPLTITARTKPLKPYIHTKFKKEMKIVNEICGSSRSDGGCLAQKMSFRTNICVWLFGIVCERICCEMCVSVCVNFSQCLRLK